MRHFTTTELERMQETQESSMMDQCIIRVSFETDRRDEYGMPVYELVDVTSICGLNPAPRPEANVPTGGGGASQVPISEGLLRLPINTKLSNVDRVTITHRFNVLLEEPVEYEFLEIPRRGPSGLVVKVKLVTNG